MTAAADRLLRLSLHKKQALQNVANAKLEAFRNTDARRFDSLLSRYEGEAAPARKPYMWLAMFGGCNCSDACWGNVGLNAKQKRAVAATIGSCVADAAARPMHWLYDQQRLDAAVGDTVAVEFWPESLSPFYTIPTGVLHYNPFSIPRFPKD